MNDEEPVEVAGGFSVESLPTCGAASKQGVSQQWP